MCRKFVLAAPAGLFGALPGEVGAGVVADRHWLNAWHRYATQSMMWGSSCSATRHAAVDPVRAAVGIRELRNAGKVVTDLLPIVPA